MIYQIDNLKTDINANQSPAELLQKILKEQIALTYNLVIAKKSIDARNKSSILIIYSLKFETSKPLNIKSIKNIRLLPEHTQMALTQIKKPALQPVIIGAGPAGLFCAIRLIERGIEPILIERGKPIEQRAKDVAQLWEKGYLDIESNPLFGEGGAGTFSDGKLNTQINDPLNQYILKTLVQFGAPPEILYEAKPHIGTDRFRPVLKNIRDYLFTHNTDIKFSTTLTDLNTDNDRINSIYTNHNTPIKTDTVFLGIGHSAHDTYRILIPKIEMISKPFAIGFRVEHPQELINRIQFGDRYHNNPVLGASTYKLTYQSTNNRHVFSFCMCPGGVVVCSSNQPDRLVINGMSNYHRNSGYANSAIVVSVYPDDYYISSALDGLNYIEDIERTAFQLGGGKFNTPAQKLTDYLLRRVGTSPQSTYQPGVTAVDLNGILPPIINDAIHEALPVFNQKMRGFITHEATLLAIETRTSSPVRIPRRADGQHNKINGLYPMGEGAGYAGGIMSAALDGIKAADHYLSSLP